MKKQAAISCRIYWVYWAALLATGVAQAQIVDTPIVLGPPKAEHFMGNVPANLPPPSPDPRNLDGHYVADIAGGSFGARSTIETPGATAGAAARNGTAQGGGNNSGAGVGSAPPHTSVANDVNAQLLCIPEAQLGFAPYGGMIVQTPGRVTIINEYNHVVRRIYLDRGFPPSLRSSYEGFSVGHWDANTLVIETRGLKSAGLANTPAVASIQRVVERLHKIDGGRRLEDTADVEGLDQHGKPIRVSVHATMLWRPDVHLLEFICEDDAGQFFRSGAQ